MLSCLKGCRAGFRAHRLARPPVPRKPSHRSRMGLNTAAVSALGHQCSICVFGAGAVGLYLASALEKAGLGPDRLSLVCRGSTYEQIKETGALLFRIYVHVFCPFCLLRAAGNVRFSQQEMIRMLCTRCEMLM